MGTAQIYSQNSFGECVQLSESRRTARQLRPLTMPCSCRKFCPLRFFHSLKPETTLLSSNEFCKLLPTEKRAQFRY